MTKARKKIPIRKNSA